MSKPWVALLSMLGLTSAGVSVQSQVLKGSTPPSKSVQTKQVKEPNAGNAANSRLVLKQQTVRQQGQGTGKQADTMTPSAYCNKVNKGSANGQLTPPPPGGNQAVTKGNQQITKGNQAVTKGNQAVTKGSQAVTKGNQAITKGNQAVTKGNQAVTKGSAVQTTAAANPR